MSYLSEFKNNPIELLYPGNNITQEGFYMWNEDRYKEEEDESADDFYREDKREALIEDDEISPREAGFMHGYEEGFTD